jgi:hypothetical protein
MGMKYILGAGIAGLIMQEILKDEGYTILTDSVGGQMKTQFPLGPRILHYSAKVNDFLLSIGIKENPREFKIGYFANDQLTNQITPDQKADYYFKTRGNVKVNTTTMSEGKNIIVGWDINNINLVDVLYQRNKENIKVLNINNVCPTNNIINNTLEYTDLISTLPLNVLQGLMSDDRFKYPCITRDVYFHYVKYDKSNYLFAGNDYDYVYNVDPEEDISRVTKLNKQEYIYEANKLVSNPYLVSHIKAKTQIANELKLTEYEGIKLVGRYAQFDHSVKSNNIIEKYW